MIEFAPLADDLLDLIRYDLLSILQPDLRQVDLSFLQFTNFTRSRNVALIIHGRGSLLAFLHLI